MKKWAAAEAKAKFSELIECARVGGAQQITRNGKLVAVVLSADEWRGRATETGGNKRTTGDFFRRSPLQGSGIELSRSDSTVREVDL